MSHRPARRERLALVLALVLGLGALPARAEGPEIVPPRLREDPGVSYPRRALEERHYESAEVVLVLEIDESGKVVGATVEVARGHGFDEAALEAAQGLRFAPAERGGTPVASRIKYRYVFEPPPPDLGSAVDSATSEPRVALRQEGGAPEPVPAPRPVEVTVRGEQPAPAVSSYTRAEVRQIPGAFGDPFRAVETLPGVTPVASGLPFFYVRGAPPGNVGYFLDGVRVPYLYHIGFGPSVVQPALVERVDLHPGGYPARFGRFAGGIVTAEATEPSAELHGEGNLRLFDLGGMVEGGFAGGRGTALVGGRYSYTAALSSLVAPEIALDYRDYQARISYELTPNDRLSVLSFGSYDLLGRYTNGILDILFGTEFYRADVRYDRRFDRGQLRAAVTLGYDRTSAGFIAGERRNVVDRSIAARGELSHDLGSTVRLRAGADVGVDAYEVEEPAYSDPDSPEARDFDERFPSRSDAVSGLWFDFVLRAAPGIEITPGFRADVFRSGSATALGLDPRVAARFEISERFRLVHAYGLAHQPPSFVLPVPGLTPARLDEGLQRSVQASAGFELDLDDATTLTSSVFYNAFFDMSDALGTASSDGPPDFDARSQGSAVGAELYLKRRLTRRLGGFVSYTLSRSLRSTDRERFLSASDRTHVANAAVAYDIGRGWRSGGRLVFYTGAPEQESPPDPTASRTTSVTREPPFFRLDLRLEKRWSFGERAFVSFVAEVMNATLSKESFGGQEIGPVVIPSLGAEAGF